MRDTLVRADDKRLIIIPNTKLITEVVVNYNGVPPSALHVFTQARQTEVAPAVAEETWPAPVQDEDAARLT
jgi:hypothetical protein